MKNLILLLPLVLVFLLLAFALPQKERIYKGNLHTHSYWSDGNTFPEEVSAWYQSNGYNFLAITDHNLLQEGDKWFSTEKNAFTKKNYEAYLEHFGGVGLETEKRDGAEWMKLRELKDYQDQFNKIGEFLLLAAEEITDASEGKPVHVNAINLSQRIKPTKGETVQKCLIDNVNVIRQTLAHDQNPEWIIVNHPNFGWAMTSQDLAQSGARFFEVYNGHPSVRNYGDETHPGTEEMWDQANIWRAENKQPLLLGIANDDAHHFHSFEIGKANPGRGWSMVKARELTPKSLYRAMVTGEFYSSTGVSIKSWKTSRKGMSIRIDAKDNTAYTTEFIAWIPETGKLEVVATVEGKKASYKFTGKEAWVRARVLSNVVKENPYQEGELEVAWLQPVVLN